QPPRSTLFPYTTLFRSKRYGGTRRRARQPKSSYKRKPCRSSRGVGCARSPPGSDFPDSGHAVNVGAAARISNLATDHSRAAGIRSEEHTSELQSPYDLA